MSASARMKPKLSEGPSSHKPTRAMEADHREGDTPTIKGESQEDDSEGDTPTINDLVSLKQGIIKTAKHKTNAPYTILLLGETGVGKSSALELIANTLAGNDIDHYCFNILDHTNELCGSNNLSKTDSARLYELTSKNGVVVRILDTPGLADPRGIQQDELHKKSVANLIKKNIDSVTAVLVVVNGVFPPITVSTEYALSTLFTFFPKSLAKNIAFMFTNVTTPFHWNFSGDIIPDALNDTHTPQFAFDNPVSLQKGYLKLKGSPSKSKEMADLRKAAKHAQQKSLEMLVNLFDWVDGLEAQSMMESGSLYEKAQTIDATTANLLAQMDQVARRKVEIDEQTRECQNTSAVMEASSQFEKTVNIPVWKQEPTHYLGYLCNLHDCHSNCRAPRLFARIRRLLRQRCAVCGHSYNSHSHTRHAWVKSDDTRTTVDEGMKQKWEAAKDKKENTEALIATHESALDDLTRAMDGAMDDLAQLVEDYDGSTLSKSFSTHMEKTIRFLEQRCTDREEGASQEQLDNMLCGLEQMKKKLELLRSAKAKGRDGVRKLKGSSIGE